MTEETISRRDMAVAYLPQAQGLTDAVRALKEAARRPQPTLTPDQLGQRQALMGLSVQLILVERDKIMELICHYWHSELVG